ncbi:uncharacterized protein LOC129329215 isoform X2 [Eublepharis macularius]|uniref:Uncharacterized protein LOC129329215 isoform X2 n=1 Tax=Eublepharis macularius TaxID=481883 RepID=A0AA97KZE1_EUBMA|nr:uncharacterized protein LOC129329215 isoform X2 [Eublepharis macularius]
MEQLPCSMKDGKMKLLWILSSGINYLLFLLFSIFLAVTGTTISASTPVPPEDISDSPSQAANTNLAPTNASSTKSPSSSTTAQPVSVSVSSTTPSLSTDTSILTREDAIAGTAECVSETTHLPSCQEP